MLRDEGVVVASSWSVVDAVARIDATWRACESGARDVRAADSGQAGARETATREAADYREIDRQLRRIAKRRAGLDVEEARWLREAEKQRIWRKLGYSTALEYLEDVFGYSPRTAMDRLRVAKELGQLPALEAAVRDGELPYSAARELTRVMTPETEEAWLASARGRNLRDIEELVAGRKKGDTPDTDKNPALIHRKRMLELSPRVDAMFEQCRAVMADELGSHVEDELLVEGLCRCFLAGGGMQESPRERASSPAPDEDVATVAKAATEANAAKSTKGVHHAVKAKAPRPAHRIIIYKCESCERAWQQGRGRTVELTAAEIALADCDGETVRWTDETPQEPMPDSEPAPAPETCPGEPQPNGVPQSTLKTRPRADLLADEQVSAKKAKNSSSRREQRVTPDIPQQIPPNTSLPSMPRACNCPRGHGARASSADQGSAALVSIGRREPRR